MGEDALMAEQLGDKWPDLGACIDQTEFIRRRDFALWERFIEGVI